MWRHGHGRRFEWFRSGRNGAIWSARKLGGVAMADLHEMCEPFFAWDGSGWLGKSTWWLIPHSKWVITPVMNGISRVNPLIIVVITHLLSGMNHQVGKLEKNKTSGHLIWTVPWLTFLHSIITKDGLVCLLTGLNLKGCNSRMSKLFQWCHDFDIRCLSTTFSKGAKH